MAKKTAEPIEIDAPPLADRLTPRYPRVLDFLPPWEEGDGPAQYVYSNRPLGARCAWSCNWTLPEGRLSADDMQPLETATPAQLLAELADLVHGGRATNRARDAFARLQDKPNGRFENDQVRLVLAEARPSYSDFVAAWLPFTGRTGGVRVVRRRLRPGWEGAPVIRVWENKRVAGWKEDREPKPAPTTEANWYRPQHDPKGA